jgi:mono/diheme cytochrome c family protein
MVKREVGFSPETRDWEFFFLNISPGGTTIAVRGRDEAENAFGGNCFACHSLATNNDFICETDHGCDPLPFDDAFIEGVQMGDARCD